VDEERRIVEGPRRSVRDFAVDTAVFVRRERSLTELDELVLADVPLPRFRGNPRRIDAAGRTARTATGRVVEKVVIDAIRIRAVDRYGKRRLVGREFVSMVLA